MNPGMAAPDLIRAKEGLRFFATAFAFLGAGAAALLLNAPRLAEGAWLHPHVVGGLHLFTLGWLSLSIFGALQVFAGVALGENPKGRALAPWIRHLWSAGALLFSAGMAFGVSRAIVAGATLLGAGLVVFTLQMALPLLIAKRGGLTRVFASVSLISLWLVWCLGTSAAFARAGAPLHALPPGYFAAHLLIALFGWVGAMVVGVGSHLVPMFALSRPTSDLPVRLALPLFAQVPILGGISAFWPDPWSRIAWVLAGAGSLFWCAQLVLYARSRLRPERDPGLQLAFLATLFLPAGWTLLLLQKPSAALGAFLLGWLTLFTLGIHHRVVPFLVWFVRFSAGTKGRPPRVKELTSEPIGFATVLFGVGGVALWTAGLALKSALLLRTGSFSLLLAWGAALSQLRYLTRRPLARTSPHDLFRKANADEPLRRTAP